MPPLPGQHTEALTELYAEADVARYIGGAALDAEGTAAQVVRLDEVWREDGFGQSALLDRGTGAFLGRAGLHPWPQRDEIELGYVLARHAQGRGLAGEAARASLDVASTRLGLDRLIAVIHPDNAPSRALATRLGSRVHREDVTSSGVRVLVHERFASRPVSPPRAADAAPLLSARHSPRRGLRRSPAPRDEGGRHRSGRTSRPIASRAGGA